MMCRLFMKNAFHCTSYAVYIVYFAFFTRCMFVSVLVGPDSLMSIA